MCIKVFAQTAAPLKKKRQKGKPDQSGCLDEDEIKRFQKRRAILSRLIIFMPFIARYPALKLNSARKSGCEQIADRVLD